ncbi:hypothetical protein J6590_018180 [Homalodisca vitripennis]|nr:hypothetical protein J6590_018180 [Homalodisca vitripennis]
MTSWCDGPGYLNVIQTRGQGHRCKEDLGLCHELLFTPPYTEHLLSRVYLLVSYFVSVSTPRHPYSLWIGGLGLSQLLLPYTAPVPCYLLVSYFVSVHPQPPPTHPNQNPHTNPHTHPHPQPPPPTHTKPKNPPHQPPNTHPHCLSHTSCLFLTPRHPYSLWIGGPGPLSRALIYSPVH